VTDRPTDWVTQWLMGQILETLSPKNSKFYQFFFLKALLRSQIEINLHVAIGKVSESLFQNYSDGFTRVNTRTLLRPIVHLVKIIKTKIFCSEQTYQHLLIVARWSRGTNSPRTRSFVRYYFTGQGDQI
jgi:hypothetical protein